MECQHDTVPPLSPSGPLPKASSGSVRLSEPESTINGDLHFLEACIQQRLHTFAFSAALSFVCSPAQVDSYEHVEIDDTSDHNSGPFALHTQALENSEFLEREAWLKMMYTTVSTIKTSALSLEGSERCSDLLAALRQEWVRMQLHKEREWLRQRDVADSCAETRTPFVDSRMFFVAVGLNMKIDVQHTQVATSCNPTLPIPSSWSITSPLYCSTSSTEYLAEPLEFC